jgi:cytochrome c
MCSTGAARVATPRTPAKRVRRYAVVGRKAGTVSGFLYSDAMRASGITWNEGLLMKWLENPDAMVKGTDLEFRVPKAEEREAVVAYLKSLTR